MQVLLGGGDAAVAEALLNDLEVGATGKEPGGVSVAQAVHLDIDADTGADQRGLEPSA
jgi:hypothetical protein